MSADILVSRLDGVRRTGQGRWLAKCPSHEDRHASLSVRELEDGRVLVHCFTGCDVQAVVSAVGLQLEDLFPPREPSEHHVKGERRPFPAADILRAVAFEAMVVALAAAQIAAGEPLSETDRIRLMLAAALLQEAVGGFGNG